MAAGGGGDTAEKRGRPLPRGAASPAHPQSQATNPHGITEAHTQLPVLSLLTSHLLLGRQRGVGRDPTGAGVHGLWSPWLPQRHCSRPQLAGEGKCREKRVVEGIVHFVQKSRSRECSRTIWLRAAALRECPWSAHGVRPHTAQAAGVTCTDLPARSLTARVVTPDVPPSPSEPRGAPGAQG